MNVLVNGVGNIGQTLLGLLCDYKSMLGITKIYALKNTEITPWNRTELAILTEKGVTICTRSDSEFTQLDSIIDEVHYVFDCNANTIGLKNKTWYESLPNVMGCTAQGSEKGFGIPFMSGTNNDVVKNQKFVQIVSCNTHALSSIITTFTNGDVSNLVDGDFVIVRRSEDIGNHQRLVGGNVLSRHLDDKIGTHHAIDVKDLYRTMSKPLSIQSSDITTPSQLMHSVRFSLLLKKMPSSADIREFISHNDSVSVTAKFDSNVVFELGRRYSPYGRLFSHSIINDNNILLDPANNRIKGWAFIPQEGNTIISTIHAFLLQMGIANEESVIARMKKEILRPSW